ncbi:hypothetical protein ACN47E_000613 [Coniothyrium glycines]
MTLTYDRLVPSTVLTVSLLLVIVSLVQFCITADAIHVIGRYFPPDSYAWYGPVGYAFDGYVDTRFVTLAYSRSTENLIFVSAGLSAMAGLMGVLAWATREWGKTMSANSWEQRSVWRDFHIAAVGFAGIAFIGTLVCTIWAGLLRAVLKRRACRDTSEETPWHGRSFFCTRELAACGLLPNVVRRSDTERTTACAETRTSRGLLVVQVFLSVMLLAAYAGHIYYARRQTSLDRRAEGRVDHMARPDSYTIRPASYTTGPEAHMTEPEVHMREPEPDMAETKYHMTEPETYPTKSEYSKMSKESCSSIE